ncbi:MAG: hypothetical protein V1678_04095 [Candidatus Aenigmatarchaeota archaeon]
MAIDASFLYSEQTLVPFLFVLAIVFGVLELTHIFRNRAVNFIIAISISFFTITNATFVSLLWSQFGTITAFFIVMFFIAFVMEVFGVRNKSGDNGEGGMIINGAILALILLLGFTHIDMIPSLPFVGGGSNLLTIISLMFILAIFWMAFKVGRETSTSAEEKRR